MNDKPPSASSPAARTIMLANRRRDTGPELAIRRALHASGRRYRVDLPIKVDENRPVRPDIVFTGARVAVFVDGCFWHRCSEHGSVPRANRVWWEQKLERTVARDRRDDERLSTAGWRVVRIWEHEATKEATGRIEAALSGAGQQSGDGVAIRRT